MCTGKRVLLLPFCNNSQSCSSLKICQIQVTVFELKKQSKWENVPPWKQISCRECSSSVAGTWSWVFCGVRGTGGSCRAWELHDWALEIPADVLHQTWCRCVTPDLVQCRSSEAVILHLLILLRGSFRLRRKFKVIHEVKIPPFPTTPIGKQGLPCLRPTVAGVAPLLFLCFPHGECECRLLRAAESVSHLWLVGDSATCELHWGDYELCVSTFSIHQAPILFVSPVSPSAILIASTFHTQLQLEAVMLQGCP